MIDQYLEEIIIFVGWRVGFEKLIFLCFFVGLVYLFGMVIVVQRSILGEEFLVVILDFWLIVIFIGMLLFFSGIVMWVLVRELVLIGLISFILRVNYVHSNMDILIRFLRVKLVLSRIKQFFVDYIDDFEFL